MLFLCLNNFANEFDDKNSQIHCHHQVADINKRLFHCFLGCAHDDDKTFQRRNGRNSFGLYSESSKWCGHVRNTDRCRHSTHHLQ